MSYIGIIVESPAKCNKIENFLKGYNGKVYKCIASYGHIRELDGLKSIDIKNNFKPTYHIIKGKYKQIEKLKSFIAKASEILLATDDDREGEAIAWHICDTFHLSIDRTKRIIFHEITEKALKNAVSNPTIINMNLVYAQKARQILDIIVGYKISPVLWTQISTNSKNALSAGRCQTPALRIVYENDNEIKNNKPNVIYQTTGYFTSKNIPFELNYECKDEKEMREFLDKSILHSHSIQISKPRNVIKKPPSPFTTSILQQVASNELHFSPKETMSICQKLYEAGYITYMRTDSTIYSNEFVKQINNYITKQYGSEYILNTDINKNKDKKGQTHLINTKANIVKVKSLAQEAHEAIRPTNILCEQIDLFDKQLGKKEEKMYKLIRRNTLESCMKHAKYIAVTANIDAPILSSQELKYSYIAEDNVFLGWKIISEKKENLNKQHELYSFMNNIKQNSIVKYNKITCSMNIKQKKSHYTEASLVKLLEKYGIGRPSTFSSLIDKIQQRGYVKKMDVEGIYLECNEFELIKEKIKVIKKEKTIGNEKNKLVLQPIGSLVIQFLLQHFLSLFEYIYTKEMEDKLDEIAKGNYKWYELCSSCLEQVNNLSKDVKKIKKDIITISNNNNDNDNSNDNEMNTINKDIYTFTIGRYGPVLSYKKDGKTLFKSIRPEIIKKETNIEEFKNKIKEGIYKLDDLILNENEISTMNEKDIIGKYEDIPIYIKTGRYGKYIKYNENNISIKHLKPQEITLENIINVIKNENKTKNSPDSIIYLNEMKTLSIRNGRFGPYVFYQEKEMKKPKFLNIKQFSLFKELSNYYKNENINNDDMNNIIREINIFIKTKYNIE